MDTFLNAVIFILTLMLTVRFFHKDGTWHISNGTAYFRFFTVLSNEVCAAAAFLMCLAPASTWAWTLKYIGTAAVTVTMMTVFLFLGPNLGYKKMFTGSDLYMHLITPLLAILSFSCYEKRGMMIQTSLFGVLPVLLYGVLYLYKVVYAPEHKRWDDFYGFNKNGKWPVSFAAMLAGGFAICMVFFLLQNR